MKVILLIASFILLVVASPVPPKHNRDDGINSLSTGIHESATPHSTANWVPTAPDRQRNTQDNTYLFGTTVDGEDVTLGLKYPKKLQPLRDLPKGLDSWDGSALDELANAISDRYMIIREVLDDTNLISQASRFVTDGEIDHLTISSNLLQTIKMPPRPQPGDPDFKGQLLKIIKHSHKRLQNAMGNRNSKLATLSNICHADDFWILNDNASTPNVYVSYVKEGKIPFIPKKQQPVSASLRTYSFGNTQDGENVTQGIGRREEMINILSLPRGLDGFGAPELALIAKDIADKAFLVRDVLNDRIRIQDAIKSLRNKTIYPRPGRLTELDLSAVSSGKNDKTELIKMIQTCHKKLRDAVNHRNGSLRELYKLQVPLTNFDTADHTNVYVTYWKDNQTLPPAGASDHLTSSFEPSKRLKTPHNSLATGDIDRNEHPELWDMLQEMHGTLGSQEDQVTTLDSSPNHLTPGHVPGHQ